MEIEFDYSKLRGRIKEKFDSYENLVPYLSYKIGSLSLKLNNHVDFSQPNILELMEVLEIPDEEISTYFFTVKVRKTEQDKQTV